MNDVIPLCQDKPICWKGSRYIHSTDSDFGKLLCGEHHKKVKLSGRSWAGGCNENCSHLILIPPPKIYGCCQDYRTIIQCNDCRQVFCFEHWIDHWHDFIYE